MSANLIDRREYRPFILALTGPSYSGKTTLGTELSRQSNLVLLDVDEQGVALEGVLGKLPRNWFETSMWMMVKYAHLHRRAGDELSAGNPVVLTATYSHETYADALRSVLADTYRRFAKLEESPLRIIALNSPVESLAERVAMRNQTGTASSVTTLGHAMELRERFVYMKGDDVVKINTGLPIEQNIGQILSMLEPLRRFPQHLV